MFCSQSARLFSERATPAQRLELRRLADQVDVLFGRLQAGADDPAFRFAVHSHHVQLHMRIAENAGSELLRLMIERNHVLILNWLFDVASSRPPLPRTVRMKVLVLSSGNVWTLWQKSGQMPSWRRYCSTLER